MMTGYGVWAWGETIFLFVFDQGSAVYVADCYRDGERGQLLSDLQVLKEDEDICGWDRHYCDWIDPDPQAAWEDFESRYLPDATMVGEKDWITYEFNDSHHALGFKGGDLSYEEAAVRCGDKLYSVCLTETPYDDSLAAVTWLLDHDLDYDRRVYQLSEPDFVEFRLRFENENLPIVQYADMAKAA